MSTVTNILIVLVALFVAWFYKTSGPTELMTRPDIPYPKFTSFNLTQVQQILEVQNLYAANIFEQERLIRYSAYLTKEDAYALLDDFLDTFYTDDARWAFLQLAEAYGPQYDASGKPAIKALLHDMLFSSSTIQRGSEHHAHDVPYWSFNDDGSITMVANCKSSLGMSLFNRLTFGIWFEARKGITFTKVDGKWMIKAMLEDFRAQYLSNLYYFFDRFITLPDKNY